MAIVNFEFAANCSGIPVESQFAFRQERCCVELRFEKALRSRKVALESFRKIFIDFQSQHEMGLKVISTGQKVLWVSYPFGCAKYFSLGLEQRVQMLGELCEEVHVEVFREQSTPLDQLNLALADVRKQGFVVEEDIGKASTSPDRRHRALLKHIVTGDRCEVVVIVSDTKKRKIVEALLLTKQPSFCFTVPKDKALLEWISNNTVKAGPARIQVHCR